MSCVKKTKSFYEEQAIKKMQNDPQMRKWYEDVVSPDRAPRTDRQRVITLTFGTTKPCAQCGGLVQKPKGEGALRWSQRKYCSVTCKRLKYETMPNMSKSSN